MSRATILVVLLLLGACSAYRDRSVAVLPAEVPVAALAGTWVEIARFPNVFQRGCGQSTATYVPRPDGDISVINACIEPGGTVRRAEGIARVAGPGLLEVSFAPALPFAWSDYLILSLDGEVAVTASPGGGLAWILARRICPTPEAIAEALALLEANGYRTERMERFDTPSLRP
ncbi:lipocalin family protein [Pontivivens ytuae]|uniref:Outer membrane lipoprotein Blc n=1 Tax=Pontivivens ytuae TaxID=2789856 RepID=A0A7S9QAR0_9RHOB|nr:lipocalin family protein [Pontivivens ytuae]QPH52353.1 lipocalin family protein [Pontivivens ytuae]